MADPTGEATGAVRVRVLLSRYGEPPGGGSLEHDGINEGHDVGRGAGLAPDYLIIIVLVFAATAFINSRGFSISSMLPVVATKPPSAATRRLHREPRCR